MENLTKEKKHAYLSTPSGIRLLFLVKYDLNICWFNTMRKKTSTKICFICLPFMRRSKWFFPYVTWTWKICPAWQIVNISMCIVPCHAMPCRWYFYETEHLCCISVSCSRCQRCVDIWILPMSFVLWVDIFVLPKLTGNYNAPTAQTQDRINDKSNISIHRIIYSEKNSIF